MGGFLEGWLALIGLFLAAAGLAVLVGRVSRRQLDEWQRASDLLPATGRPLGLRPVRITELTADGTRVWVTFDVAAGPDREQRASIVADGADAAVGMRLEHWRAEQTVLLLLTGEGGEVDLIAPDGVTSGLRIFEAHVPF